MSYEIVNNHNCFCLIFPIYVAAIKEQWIPRELKWTMNLLID